MPSALPATMRAAVYRAPRDLRVEERPVPAPGPRDVLVEVACCGVCGTDLHLVWDGWGAPDTIGGHEWSGRIVAVGAEVSGFAVGDRVVGGPEPACGDCAYCRARRPGLCARRRSPGVGGFQGAFAEYVRVPASSLLRVPGDLPPRVAALCEPLAVALHGITLSGIRPGESALVTGAGPIGALTLAALRVRGVDDVRVCEPAPARRALARKLGASRVAAPDALQIPGLPFDLVDDPVDVVFECSGRRAAVEAGLAQLRRAGRLVLVGTGMERPHLDTNRVLLNELVLTGAYVYDADGCADALALLAEGRLPTDLLVAPGAVPLEGLSAAIEALAGGRIAGKVMIVPRPPTEEPT